MDYKQFASDLVYRTVDWVRVPVDDPGFLAWVAEGNSPFPPDPPSEVDIEALR